MQLHVFILRRIYFSFRLSWTLDFIILDTGMYEQWCFLMHCCHRNTVDYISIVLMHMCTFKNYIHGQKSGFSSRNLAILTRLFQSLALCSLFTWSPMLQKVNNNQGSYLRPFLSALELDFFHFDLDIFLSPVLICSLSLPYATSLVLCASLSLSNPLYKPSGLWPWEPNLHHDNHNFRHVPTTSLPCVCVCVWVCSPAVEQMECSLCSRW